MHLSKIIYIITLSALKIKQPVPIEAKLDNNRREQENNLLWDIPGSPKNLDQFARSCLRSCFGKALTDFEYRTLSLVTLFTKLALFEQK